jgi:hypothetical protein
VKLAAMMLLVMAVVAAGCGGKGDSSSKAAYIAKADRICQATRDEIAPLVQRIGVAAVSGSVSRSELPALAAAVERLHAIGSGYLARLERLRQPSGDRAALERFLDPSRQVVAALGRASSALRAGNVTAALSLLQAGTPTAQEANTAAQAYGFKQCLSVLPSGG